MSPICQSFVQNTWRKDLCSNCFKSEEDHGTISTREFSHTPKTEYIPDGGGGIGRRYVGVAGRQGLYSRNYYGNKSWNSTMIDESNKDSRLLRSPGLIKGMNSIINQENEKNRNLNGFDFDHEESNHVQDKYVMNDVMNRTRFLKESNRQIKNVINNSNILKDATRYDINDVIGRSQIPNGSNRQINDVLYSTKIPKDPNYYQNSDAIERPKLQKDTLHEIDEVISRSQIPKDSWILTQIIGDPKGVKTPEGGSERLHGDSSSDLGSDASHETSGNTSGCSEGELKADSDASSVKSEQDSAHEEDSPVHGILKSTPSISLHRALKVSISFNDDNEVIGYGGDVDYSDDDDYFDDDDDDNSSISSSELTPEDKHLKRLTERNTNFNSENENLDKDINTAEQEKILHRYDSTSTKPDILETIDKLKTEIVDETSSKQEVKVKLKRSQPILGSKPLIKPNLSLTFPSSVPNSVNTQGSPSKEVIPMQGIKPKFVSREDEMKETAGYDEIYERKERVTAINSLSKVTSIDDLPVKITSIDKLPPKVTSIDDIAPKDNSAGQLQPETIPVKESSPRITSIDDQPVKITNFDMGCEQVEKINYENVQNSPTSKTKSIVGSRDEHLEACSNVLNSTTENTSSTPATTQSSSIDDIISLINNTPPKGSVRSGSRGLKSAKRFDKNDEPLKVTYVDDMSTYDCQPDISPTSTLPVSKEKEVPFFSVKSSSTESFSNLNTENCSDNYDYSVKSGPSDYMKNIKAKTKSKENVETKLSLEEIENTEENLEKVSSAVIPMNMITIQRRSSFMESQLGGSMFSIESPSNSLKSPVAENKQSFSATPKEMVHAMEKEKIVSKDKTNPAIKENSKENEKTKSCNSVHSLAKSFNKEIKTRSESKEILEKEVNQKEGIKVKVCETDVCNKNYENISYTAKVAEQVKVESKDKESTKVYENVTPSTTKSKTDVNPTQNIEKNKVLDPTGSLSTFGTPVSSGKTPNSSFLHSGAVRPAVDSNEINSVIYSTPDFLKDIKSHSSQTPVTASIQKSALYASSSCLKGVPLGKPATTPKPNYLKDKPKVPIKPFMNSPNNQGREILYRKLSSEKSLSNNNAEILDGVNSVTEVNEKGKDNMETRKPPPSSEAPKIPTTIHKEIVYDVPVTMGSSSSPTFSSPSPSSSSSGYSSTSIVSQNCANINNTECIPKDDEKPQETKENSTTEPTQSANEQNNLESHYRSKFEATRNLLTESLSFQNKITSNKDEEPVNATQESSEQNVHTEDPEPLNKQEDQKEQQSNSEVHSTPAFHPPLSIPPPSYVNLPSHFDNHDVDSYSSFTDDFDDDEDEDEDYKTNRNEFLNIDNRENAAQPLRRTERSSSATPLFRNSVGPINFSPIQTVEDSTNPNTCLPTVNKLPAARSQSVPRSNDHVINPSVFSKIKPESGSKFGFKSGFFRPSSPPSIKRKISSERGRDRTKKSHSGFSLLKLLRFGSGEKSFKNTKEPKSPKEQERTFQRETRRLKLEIIHPLDYNTNGVEVISRPEKKSPSYDFTGINDPLVQEALRQHAKGAEEKKPPEPLKSSSSSFFGLSTKKEESNNKKNTNGKVAKKNSFLRKKRKPERVDSQRSESNFVLTESIPTATAAATTVTPKDDFNLGNSCSNSVNNISSSTSKESVHHTSSNLGFNSEGRPRPPPPPRKTSLDANCQEFLKGSGVCPTRNHSEPNFAPPSSSSSKTEGDTSSLSSTCSSTRPTRPPPPRRTPSNCGASQAGQGMLQRTKDSVYANLGNARAPFTPCKPGRTSSIRDEEREKRRAPNPPPPSQHHHHQLPPKQKQEKERPDFGRSLSSSSQEKTIRQRGRRGSVVTNLSLEDQYGAVIFANLEALSNMLDQMCSHSECGNYEMVKHDVSSWSHISIRSNDPISCGLRQLYSGTAVNCDVTVMVSQETKVEVDPLMMPLPLVTFKDDIPARFIPTRKSPEYSRVAGSVWIFPRMSLCSLEEFSHMSHSLLQERPSDWERRICLFLLQLVSALKQLQAKGIEEASLDMILVITEIYGDDNPRLWMGSSVDGTPCMKSDSDSSLSLCHCAATVTQLLLGHSQPLEAALKGPILSPPLAPSPHAFSALVATLREERSSSLTKAKCILEAMLFGPEDMKIETQPDGEVALQKWLDLERANVLHSMVKEQAAGSFNKNCVYSKFHLLFLVRTNVKALKDALRTLEVPDITNF